MTGTPSSLTTATDRTPTRTLPLTLSLPLTLTLPLPLALTLTYQESDRPMLTLAERELLYSDAAAVDVTTGTGKAEDSAPPELKRLLQDR